jgi:DNA-binding transcriptional ArsR family regulator
MKLIKLDALTDAAECLKTLAHPARLRMLEMLFVGEFTVGRLADACGIAPHIASEHLGKMRDRGLLTAERRGRCIFYAVAKPGLKGIIQCMDENFGGKKEVWKG